MLLKASIAYCNCDSSSISSSSSSSSSSLMGRHSLLCPLAHNKFVVLARLCRMRCVASSTQMIQELAVGLVMVNFKICYIRVNE